MSVPTKCTVENKVITPCFVLRNSFEPRHTKRKGLSLAEYVYVATGEKTRTLVILKSGEFKGKGIALNFCPFCGANIQATQI